jgi:hypothetical protein
MKTAILLIALAIAPTAALASQWPPGTVPEPKCAAEWTQRLDADVSHHLNAETRAKIIDIYCPHKLDLSKLPSDEEFYRDNCKLAPNIDRCAKKLAVCHGNLIYKITLETDTANLGMGLIYICLRRQRVKIPGMASK